MDWRLAKKLGLKTELLERTISAKGLNEKDLFTVTHITEDVEIHIQEHQESMNFFLFNSPSHALIFGLPWLLHHNPHIDWRTGKILGWGTDCVNRCFDSLAQGRGMTMLNIVSADSPTDPEYPDLSSVPSCYHHIKSGVQQIQSVVSPSTPTLRLRHQSHPRFHHPQGTPVFDLRT